MSWQDTEKCDTFSLPSRDVALDGRPTAAANFIRVRLSMARSPSEASKRKDKVAHIRLSQAEFDALEAAADAAELTVSAFIRSLSLEGAGVRPFLGSGDCAVLALLAEGMRAIGGNLNQITRAINTGRLPADGEVAASIKDAHAVATAITSELTEMTKRSAATRRVEGS